ncbi:MAG: S8 family serine peptidase [Candidatus Marinimicrobia bacterium]|nr:S8 family serine peptidase [Candidatus Neomarinimicrobiota bacterium]
MHKTICKSLLLLMIPGILFSNEMTATSLAKLSPNLQTLVVEKTSEAPLELDKHFSSVQIESGRMGEIVYPVTIKSTNIEAVKAAGIMTNSDFPGFSTARVTYEQLLVLTELGAVTSVFQGDLLYPLNDLAVGLSGADLVHDAYLNSTAYDGTGVIILVVDTGIDFTHLDFRDPDTPTTSRILYIWDQTGTTGSSTPQDRDGTNFSGLNYGIEYTKAQIENEIDGSPAGVVLQTDSNGHGTEVTGAAAGNGASLTNKKYKGMAHKAEIVMVKPGNSSFSDARVKDALTYAEKLSSTTGKPVVVNLSLGSQSNAHDGTSTLDAAVNSFTSSGNGRVAVIAAGNAGNEDIHVTGEVAASDTGIVTINVPSFTPNAGINDDGFYLELWWNNSDNITVKLVSPNSSTQTRTVGQDPGGFVYIGTDGIVDMNNIIDADHSNGDRMTELIVLDHTGTDVAEGDWILQLINNSSSAMTYHAWMYQSTMNATVTGGDHNYTIASPGTASSAITVGAYTARWRWQGTAGYVNFGSPDLSDDHSYFSSYGPNREGGSQKPDIMTPGQGVVTTTSTDYTPTTAYEIVADKYHLEQGTSVAAGTISGAAALLLDYNTSLTAAQVKSYITGNADSDSYTGSVPNDEWGYGKLNIMESMAAAIGGGTTLYHKIYANDAWGTSDGHLIDNTVKEAVKFTATEAGEVTGAYFVTNQTIPGSGSISFEIWTDVSGLPSTKVGSTVTMNCTDMGKNTWNYVSLTDVGVNVLASENFHLVMRNTSGSIFSLRKSTSSISNKSSNDLGIGWAALTDRDWRMRAIVSNNTEVTDSSLPVVLSFFNAGTYKGQMVLKWATESETENLGFKIERRKNGAMEWKLIADHTKDPNLQGQGNSTSRTDYIYYDKTAKPGVKYDYRLSDIPYTGAYKSNYYVLEDIELRIENFFLHKNYPNPFNPATTISYELADDADVQIKIIDVNGREVQSWKHHSQEKGYHEMVWAGVNQSGKPVSAGLYLLSVQAGNQFQTRKLLLLK